MAKYYYEKWSTTDEYYDFRNPTSWRYVGIYNSNFIGGYIKEPTFSSRRGFEVDTSFANSKDLYATKDNFQEAVHKGGGSIASRFLVTQDVNGDYVIEKYEKTCQYSTRKVRYRLLETIEAEEGTYPDNGIQGNYWYVKKGLTFPELKMKVDGQLKTSENGWVKVDEQLKTIDKMWTKVDGQLKEV